VFGAEDSANGASTVAAEVIVSPALPPATVEAATIDADERVVLVIDSDPDRAGMAVELLREHGARAIVARRQTAALGLAREHRPAAVLLAGGPARVESALGQLKKHPDTRHLPVVVVADPAAEVALLRAGAAAFVEDPADAESLGQALGRLERLSRGSLRRIALVTEQTEIDDEIAHVLSSGEDIELVQLDPAGALAILREGSWDLAVVTVEGRPSAAFDFLQEITTEVAARQMPVIALVSQELPKTDRAHLEALAKSAVITVADSPERLAERSALFLHRMEATLPTSTRRLLGQLRTGDAPLQGRKVLVVDDDIRNVFALTSSLEQRGMKVVFAENGREGIERLQQHPNTDLVLLDIMMPEMDGYETARAIRAMPRFEHLPIISLTAKAMKGDREKALDAGASDYITKPVDLDHLVSMMRVWLST
jgi:CheY-like chemotaxis protein